MKKENILDRFDEQVERMAVNWKQKLLLNLTLRIYLLNILHYNSEIYLAIMLISTAVNACCPIV